MDMKVEQAIQAQRQLGPVALNIDAAPSEKQAKTLQAMKADVAHELRHRDGKVKLVVILTMLLVMTAMVWAMG